MPRRTHSWKVAWLPSTTKQRVQSVVDASEEGSDRELVLDRFQKVLSEVTNTNHPIRGTVGGYQQRLKRTNPKAILPKAGTRIGSTGQYHVEV